MTSLTPAGDAAAVPPPLHPLAPARLFRLARKELTEILRDRRTIVTLVVMPLLLYPLLTIGFGQFVFSARVSEQVPTYHVGLPRSHQEFLRNFLMRCREAADRAVGPVWTDNAAPELLTEGYDDIDEAVRERLIDVGFRVPPPDQPNRAGEWDLVYREDSAYAAEAVRYLQQLTTTADAYFLRSGLEAKGFRLPPAPRLRSAPLAVERRSGQALAVFVPLVLILMTMTGAVYPAIDLTAGERERGTLEVLIASPVPRVSLLFGKYVAVVAVAVLTALANLGSMTVSLLVTDWLHGGVAEQVFGPAGLRPVTLLEILGLVLLFAAFFSAVLLVLTSFARSFKEAQAYLIPLMVVALLPGLVGLWPGLPLTGIWTVVPLLNIVLLARDLLDQRADPVSGAVVVISTLTYAVLAISLAAQVFGAEGVLYGESGGWRALLRRGP